MTTPRPISLPPEPKPIKRFRPAVIPTLFMLAGVALLLTLGTWQTQEFRVQAAFAELYQRQHVDLPQVTSLVGTGEDPARLDKLNFRRAQLHGKMAVQDVRLMTAPNRFGKSGYMFLVPLAVTGGKTPLLLVNLGWVPKEEVASFVLRLRTRGEVTIAGRLQRPDARDPVEQQVGDFEGIPTWTHPNTTALSKQIPGLDPDLVLQAGRQADSRVIDLQTVPIQGYAYPVDPTPAKTFAYAATSFGLLLALIAAWVALSRREELPD